jgi:hypothetical protein
VDIHQRGRISRLKESVNGFHGIILIYVEKFLIKFRMQKRILQTGFLSILVTTLFAACPVITCGCSPGPLALLTLSSKAESIAQGSSAQITVKVSEIYDQSAWPLQVVIKPAQEPQLGNLPEGVTTNTLLLTKEIPSGVLTLRVSKLTTPGSYNLVVYPTSGQNGYSSFREDFTLTVTTQP